MRYKLVFSLSISIVFCMYFFFQPNLSNAQISDLSKKTINREPQSSKENQNLQIKYSDAVEFKTISRKNIYRIGELISVDYAMLNITDEPIRILNIDHFVGISIKDENNRKVGGRGGSPPLYGISYQLVKPNEYVASRIFYVIGCQDVDNSYRSSTSNYFFDSNYFAFKGRGCIDIKEPGKYFISTHANNKENYSNNNIHKVVVGEIESVPLEITVIK